MAIWAAALPQKIYTRKQSATIAPPRRYMPGAPEIYFDKAIDNSRLVRTRDIERRNEMRVFFASVAIVFLVLLLDAGQHYRSQVYGYRIEEARTQCDQLADVNRTLRLEEATLKNPERIDALAGQMGLARPAVGQVQQMEASGNDSGVPVMARAGNISVVSVPN